MNGLVLIALFLELVCSCESTVRNVVLVMVDDLRTEIGSYGSKDVRTPHFDNFAANSIQFENAFVPLPKCGPSRVSMLTGKEPSRSGYYFQTKATHEARLVKSSMSMFTWFRKKGYSTFGFGKIFHYDTPGKAVFNKFEGTPNNLASECIAEGSIICPSENDELSDLSAVRNANQTLEKLSKYEKPWLLAVGFRRPHLKWVYPERLEMEAPTVSSPLYPIPNESIPEIARRSTCKDISVSKQLLSSKYTTTGLVEPSLASQLRFAYFRTVEWVDELLGMLVSKLEETGLDKNAVIVIVSDHGFNLGENGDWCKMSLQRPVLRVPFWVKDPRTPSLAGQKITTPIQLVDLFPTVADLAGVPVDLGTKKKYSIDGVSVQQAVNPSVPISKETKQILNSLSGPFDPAEPSAFSILQRCKVPGCEKADQKDFHAVGYCIHTEQYRYVEWRSWVSSALEADWNAPVVALELYDIQADSHEISNLAMLGNTSQQLHLEILMSRFSKELRAHFVDCSRYANSRRVRSRDCDKRGPHCKASGRYCVTKTS